MKFKAGDRVKVYTATIIHLGTIHSIATGNETYGSLPIESSLQVKIDGSNEYKWFHSKQCRKIKQRRRVWVSIHTRTGVPVRVNGARCEPEQIDGEHWEEYIQVKK